MYGRIKKSNPKSLRFLNLINNEGRVINYEAGSPTLDGEMNVKVGRE